MEIDISQISSNELEIEFDRIRNERSDYYDAAHAFVGLGVSYSFMGQGCHVVLLDDETRVEDMEGPNKEWNYTNPNETPSVLADEVQIGRQWDRFNDII